MKHFNKMKALLLPLVVILAFSTSAFAQLNGTYTVYGTGANYTDLQAAANALNSQGVSGPVVFKIRPGVWTSSSTSDASINNITGASATNTITFEAENGDASTTEIRNTNTSSSSSSNFIFRFNSAKYVRVRNLTLNKTYSSRGRVLYYVGSAQHNKVENCIMKGSTSTSTSSSNYRIYGTSLGSAHNNEVNNNTIEGGAGIYWRGSSSSSSGLSADNSFVGNTITNPSRYAIYAYYTSNLKFNNNTITNPSTGYWYGIYLWYADNKLEVKNNTMTQSGTGYYTYGIYMYYCDGSAGNMGDISGNTIDIKTSSSYVYGAYTNRCKYQNVKNNTFNANARTSTSFTRMYPAYNYFSNDMNYEGNTFNSTGRYYAYGYFSYYGSNNTVKNNTINMNSTGYYSYCYAGYYTNNIVADGNTIKLRGDRGAYNYTGYRCNDFTVINNEFDVESQRGSVYGNYQYLYGNSKGLIAGNKVNARIVSSSSSWNSCYGYYLFYGDEVDVYNNAIWAKSSARTYAMYMYYSKKIDFYNNSVHCEGTGSTSYGLYEYHFGGGYNNITMRNSVFSSTSSNSRPFYTRQPQDLTMDYNNFYKANGLGMVSTGSGNYNTIAAWRNTDHGRNSLTYDPGYKDAANGDLEPDPTKPASWSVQGRGIQIAGNNKDINGNARATTTIQGVPDLGPYEFTPTSTPPNAVATPAAPTASTSQVYTFGQDTVAVVNWGATVPTGTPAMKQYSGINPPGVLTINPTQMFFYTDFQGTGSALNYGMNLYYKDPWMGTIASESALRLAENVGSAGWSGYSPAVSSSNTVNNYIATPSVGDVGALHTGIDVKDNAGADGIVDPAPPFCPGTYTVKMRIKNNGNNAINSLKIGWTLNGVAQPTIVYNTTIGINGSPSGNEATITLGNINFANDVVNIKAWTFEPNGNTDPVPGDDTANVDYRAALKGVFTIGGTTPDFANAVDAVDALNNYGTCGDVTFDMRPGVYTGQLNIKNPASVGPQGRVTFQSENGNANGVTINYGTNGANLEVITFDNADMFTFKNLTISGGPTNARTVAFYGRTDNDSLIGCNINAPNIYNFTNSAIYANGSQTGFDGENLVIKDCNITGGNYTVYVYNRNYTKGFVLDNNTINTQYMGLYMWYSNGAKVTRNTITGATNAFYGLYMWYMYQSPDLSYNKITMQRGIGMFSYYIQGSSSKRAKVENNAIAMTTGASANAGMEHNYFRYTDVTHNSINVTNTNTGCRAAELYNTSSYYGNNRVRNNVFANTGGGMSAYIRDGGGNTYDYNNHYATGSTFGYWNGNKSTFAAYRTSSNQEKHSLSYEPGFTSATDLRPDKTKAASWSLNGRAVQIAGDVMDIEGNARIDDVTMGTPDIGAYEFEPESTPPAAKANPATADPGDTQIFTFGDLEVGRVTWGTQLPIVAPIEVRQYSGRKGAGIAAAAAPKGSMYFYTTVESKNPSTTYDFDLNLNYMGIWMGDISNESELRLAHKYNTNYPWMVFSGNLSNVNTATDIITGPSLIHFGSFTGLENGSITSAFVRPQGSAVICIGNDVTLAAEPVVAGNTYQWKRNGVDIAGATGQTYSAGQPGDYAVIITNGSSSVEAVPITVSTIAPPNALVSANGPLTYCVGNGLTLDAGNAQGVKYQWQLNGTDIPGADKSTYPVNQSGTYTVVVRNIGCATTSTPTPVTSGPLSVALGNDTSYCEVKNQFLVLDAGYPGAKYTWNTGDTSRQITVKQSGTYTVTVNGGPNCIGTDNIQVNIDPLPRSNGISYVKNGNEYQFSPGGPSGVIGYLWLFSDGTTSNQQFPRKVLDGELYVRLVMYNACGSDTSTLGWPLSVDNVTDDLGVNVYPNPATEQVTLSLNGADMEDVQILNSLGAVVYSSEVDKGSSKHTVNVSGLANGHYMIRAVTSAGIISKPFDIIR